MNTINQQQTNPFRERYQQLSDEKIKEILRLRKNYQPEAAEAAINEAIARNIIYSRQDLLAEEYNTESHISIRFFPTIHKTQQKQKIKRSICRVFFLAGIIPLIHGGLQLFQNKNNKWAILIILGGIIWLFLNYQYSKTNHKKYWYSLLLLLIAGGCYTFYALFSMKIISIMDITITSICCLLIAYCLFFLRSIKK